ncbi:MAG TPA: hypothetical protein VK168_22165 [Saprospiraceae bacterium]|nr:hypothetical protein [Saprospiraceae bacterium]
MRYHFKLILCVCYLLLFQQGLTAQAALEKGYYLSKPDSTREDGYFYLEEHVFGIIDFYLSDKGDKTKVLRPEDVYLIATDKGSVLLPLVTTDGSKSIFIRRLIAAGASLYEGKIDKANVYYINSINNPELIKVNKTAPQAFLSAYLGEKCAPATPIRYHKSELVSAINKYGKCMGFPIVKPAKKPFLLNVSVGLRGTYYNQSPSTSGYYIFPFKPVDGFITGGDIMVGLLKSLHLRVGIARTKIVMRGADGTIFPYFFRGFPFEFVGPFQFSYQSDELPIELIWYWNKSRKFSPLFGGGVTYIWASNPIIDQDLIGPVDFKPNLYSFTKEEVQAEFFNGELITLGNPRKFWQFRAGFLYRIHKRLSLEFTARYMKRQELFYYTGAEPPAGYFFKTHQSWFDYSLAIYLPLVINKPIR